MTNTWIPTTNERIVNLIGTATAIGRTTTVIAITPSAPAVGGVDTIIHAPVVEDVPAEVYAGIVVGLLTDAKGDVILVVNRSARCSFAGVVVATFVPPVVVGATSVSAEGAEVTRHGGLTNETVAFKGAVLIPEGGAAPEAGGPTVQAHEGTLVGATVADVQPAGPGPASLATARHIVSCRRGFKAEENPGLARTLAEALGTEIACPRPLVKDMAWLSKDRYVGVPGMHVTPDVYVTLGISDQVQHTSGVADSKVVVVVNNDASAPILRISGYDIVSDVYDVVPTLTAALS